MVTKVVKNASSIENLPLDTPLLTYVHKGKLPKNPLLGSRSQSHDTMDDQRDYFHHYSTNSIQQQQNQDQDDNESIGNGSLSDIPKDSTFYQNIYARQGYPAASNAQFSSQQQQQQQQQQLYYQQAQLSSGPHPPADYLSFSSVNSNPPPMNDPYDPSKPPLQYKQLLKGLQPVNPHSGSFSLRDFLKGCTTANSSNYSTSSSAAASLPNGRGKSSFPTAYNPNSKKQSQRPSKTTFYNESSSNTSCGDESTLQDDYIDENEENDDDLQQIAIGRYHEDHPIPTTSLLSKGSGSRDPTSFQQHLINENIQLKTRNGLNISDLNLSISPSKEERRRKEEEQQPHSSGGNDELSSQFLSSHSSDEYNTLSPKELSKALFVASVSPSKSKKSESAMRDVGSGANTDNEGSNLDNDRYPPFSTNGSRNTSPNRSGKTRGNSITTTTTSSRHSSPAISRQNSKTNIVYPYSQQGQHLHEQSVLTMNTYTHPKTKKVMVDKSIQSNQLRHAQLTKKYDGSLNDFMVYTEIVHDKATDMDYDLLLTMNENINLDYYNEEEIDLMKKSLHNPLLLMHQVMDLKRQVR
jgi:hypothetical protein